jgi:hypothetical protein
MLMSQALIEYLQIWQQGKLKPSQDRRLQEEVVTTLFHRLVQVIDSQQLNGSWGTKGPIEETAYAILTLARLIVLPLAQYFRTQIISAIDRGRSFLLGVENQMPEHLWIEKVSYGSEYLAEAYNIAALYIPIDRQTLGKEVAGICDINSKEFSKFGILINQGPLSKSPRWLVLASWIEGKLSGLGQLLPRQEKASFEMEAFRWHFSNNRTQSSYSLELLQYMMDLSWRKYKVTLLTHNVIIAQNENETRFLVQILRDAADYFSECDTMQNGVNNTIGKDEKTNVSMVPNEKATTTGNTKGELNVILAHLSTPESGKPRLSNGNEKLVRFCKQVSKGKESHFQDSKHIQNTVSQFIDFVSEKLRALGSKSKSGETLRSECKRFFSSHTAHLEAEIANLSQDDNGCPKDHAMSFWQIPLRNLPCNILRGITGIPLMFCFAANFHDEKIKQSPTTGLQDVLSKDIREHTEACFLIRQELGKPPYNLDCSEATSLRRSVEHLLCYEQNLLSLAIQQLNLLSSAPKTSRVMALIAEFAEVSSEMLVIR